MTSTKIKGHFWICNVPFFAKKGIKVKQLHKSIGKIQVHFVTEIVTEMYHTFIVNFYCDNRVFANSEFRIRSQLPTYIGLYNCKYEARSETFVWRKYLNTACICPM